MALDRQSIEKRDFPVGVRGYDPEAVDGHLSALADEVAEYKRSSRRRTDDLASSASEQVRAIVEAAETSAAEIQREAERDAQEIREEARSEAQVTRDQAAEQAHGYLGKVSESTNTVIERLNAIQHELDGLRGSLHDGSDRLTANLRELEGDLHRVSESAAARRRTEFEPDSAAAPDAAAAPVTESAHE
ncbi:MAG: DivIVA domain-containing protein, partial [Solirubrobacteraceae bacterium]